MNMFKSFDFLNLDELKMMAENKSIEDEYRRLVFGEILKRYTSNRDFNVYKLLRKNQELYTFMVALNFELTRPSLQIPAEHVEDFVELLVELVEKIENNSTEERQFKFEIVNHNLLNELVELSDKQLQGKINIKQKLNSFLEGLKNAEVSKGLVKVESHVDTVVKKATIKITKNLSKKALGEALGSFRDYSEDDRLKLIRSCLTHKSDDLQKKVLHPLPITCFLLNKDAKDRRVDMVSLLLKGARGLKQNDEGMMFEELDGVPFLIDLKKLDDEIKVFFTDFEIGNLGTIATHQFANEKHLVELIKTSNCTSFLTMRGIFRDEIEDITEYTMSELCRVGVISDDDYIEYQSFCKNADDMVKSCSKIKDTLVGGMLNDVFFNIDGDEAVSICENLFSKDIEVASEYTERAEPMEKHFSERVTVPFSVSHAKYDENGRVMVTIDVKVGFEGFTPLELAITEKGILFDAPAITRVIGLYKKMEKLYNRNLTAREYVDFINGYDIDKKIIDMIYGTKLNIVESFSHIRKIRFMKEILECELPLLFLMTLNENGSMKECAVQILVDVMSFAKVMDVLRDRRSFTEMLGENAPLILSHVDYSKIESVNIIRYLLDLIRWKREKYDYDKCLNVIKMGFEAKQKVLYDNLHEYYSHLKPCTEYYIPYDSKKQPKSKELIVTYYVVDHIISRYGSDKYFPKLLGKENNY